MIPTLIIIGWFVIGLALARGTFVWRVKRGLYSGYGSSMARIDTHVMMTLAVVFSVLYATGLAICFIATHVGKLLISNPPETNREKEQRRLSEKREMQDKIDRLERELGIR